MHAHPGGVFAAMSSRAILIIPLTFWLSGWCTNALVHVNLFAIYVLVQGWVV